MENEELKSTLERVIYEIQQSPIIIEEEKETAIKLILKELKNVSRQSWFNCKMILWKNRYDTVEKDAFFKWLFSTNLQKLIEMKQGGNK